MNWYGSNKVADIEEELGEWLICPEMSRLKYYNGADHNVYLDMSNAIPCLKEHCAKYKMCCYHELK